MQIHSFIYACMRTYILTYIRKAYMLTHAFTYIQDIVDGVAALLELSRCRHLVGTSRSTYLILAAALSASAGQSDHIEYQFYDVRERCRLRRCRFAFPHAGPNDCW